MIGLTSIAGLLLCSCRFASIDLDSGASIGFYCLWKTSRAKMASRNFNVRTPLSRAESDGSSLDEEILLKAELNQAAVEAAGHNELSAAGRGLVHPRQKGSGKSAEPATSMNTNISPEDYKKELTVEDKAALFDRLVDKQNKSWSTIIGEATNTGTTPDVLQELRTTLQSMLLTQPGTPAASVSRNLRQVREKVLEQDRQIAVLKQLKKLQLVRQTCSS